MGKIKIYEIAKKLDLASKEIVEMAKKLNIEVKIIPNTVYKKLSPSQKEKYFNLKDFISKIDIEKIISKYENK